MIRINGIMYNAEISTAADGSMRFTFDSTDTLEQIESTFQKGLKVEIYEQNEIVAAYYNKETRSITVSGKDPRTVTVTLITSPVSLDVEAKLENRIRVVSNTVDLNGDGIQELAEIMSDMVDESRITADAIEELASLVSDLIEKVDAIPRNIEIDSEDISDPVESEAENG